MFSALPSLLCSQRAVSQGFLAIVKRARLSYGWERRNSGDFYQTRQLFSRTMGWPA